ncbi:MAG: UMP kinase, partial [Nanoarchaeota archaeon]
YAYDKDPRKFPGAEPILRTDWKTFRSYLPKKWDPGLNSPFDPIASKEAQKLKLKVIIANGRNIKNLKNIFENKDFKGSIIE